MAPVNDNFADAIAIGGPRGSATGTNVDATVEGGEPVPSERSDDFSTVWWKWTSPGHGGIEFNLTGSDDIDTVIGVWTGTTLAGLTEVAFNDDGDGDGDSLRSRVGFCADAGVVYYLQVGGYDSGPDYQGALVLAWQPADVSVDGSAEWTYTGASDTFVVPEGVASVGYEAASPAIIFDQLGTLLEVGKGVVTFGTLPVTLGETLDIYVGGPPPDVTTHHPGRIGGWPDGGDGGVFDMGFSSYMSTGGSGSSSIRRGSSPSGAVVVAGGPGGFGGPPGIDTGVDPNPNDGGRPDALARTTALQGDGATTTTAGAGGTPVSIYSPAGEDGDTDGPGAGGDGGAGGLITLTPGADSGPGLGNASVDGSGNYLSGPLNVYNVLVPAGFTLRYQILSSSEATATDYRVVLEYFLAGQHGAVVGDPSFPPGGAGPASYTNTSGADQTIPLWLYAFALAGPLDVTYSIYWERFAEHGPGAGAGGGWKGGGGGAALVGGPGGVAGGGSSYADPSIPDATFTRWDEAGLVALTWTQVCAAMLQPFEYHWRWPSFGKVIADANPF